MNSRDIASIELERLKNDAGRLQEYDNARISFLNSGVAMLLRMFGRPYTTDGGANPYASAYSAAYCEGYNKCLDDLLYFDELYIAGAPKHKKLEPTFGALELALQRRDISKAEYDKLKGKV